MLLYSILPHPFLPAKLTDATIYAAKFTALFWLVSRPLFTLGCLAFAMIKPTDKGTALQVFRFLVSYLFLNQPGPLLALDGGVEASLIVNF